MSRFSYSSGAIHVHEYESGNANVSVDLFSRDTEVRAGCWPMERSLPPYISLTVTTTEGVAAIHISLAQAEAMCDALIDALDEARADSDRKEVTAS